MCTLHCHTYTVLLPFQLTHPSSAFIMWDTHQAMDNENLDFFSFFSLCIGLYLYVRCCILFATTLSPNMKLLLVILSHHSFTKLRGSPSPWFCSQTIHGSVWNLHHTSYGFLSLCKSADLTSCKKVKKLFAISWLTEWDQLIWASWNQLIIVQYGGVQLSCAGALGVHFVRQWI